MGKRKQKSSKAVNRKKCTKSNGPDDEEHRRTVLDWLEEDGDKNKSMDDNRLIRLL